MKLCTNFGAIVLLIAMMPMLLGSCSKKKRFKFAVEATIPNSREDINRIDYTGKYLMSTANWNPKTEEWVMHHADGIKYTLPVGISHTLSHIDGPIYPRK